MQISHEIGDPRIGSMPRVVRGMKREQRSADYRTRLPITPEILSHIRQYWKERQAKWDILMLWAAMTLCFYGLLWAGEVVILSDAEFDSSHHLTYGGG